MSTAINNNNPANWKYVGFTQEVSEGKVALKANEVQFKTCKAAETLKNLFAMAKENRENISSKDADELLNAAKVIVDRYNNKVNTVWNKIAQFFTGIFGKTTSANQKLLEVKNEFHFLNNFLGSKAHFSRYAPVLNDIREFPAKKQHAKVMDELLQDKVHLKPIKSFVRPIKSFVRSNSLPNFPTETPKISELEVPATPTPDPVKTKISTKPEDIANHITVYSKNDDGTKVFSYIPMTQEEINNTDPILSPIATGISSLASGITSAAKSSLNYLSKINPFATSPNSIHAKTMNEFHKNELAARRALLNPEENVETIDDSLVISVVAKDPQVLAPGEPVTAPVDDNVVVVEKKEEPKSSITNLLSNVFDSINTFHE